MPNRSSLREVQMPDTGAAPACAPSSKVAPSPLSEGDPRGVPHAGGAAVASNRGVRRRFVDPTSCERDYTAAEQEFLQAMQAYKQRSGRLFPTWSEVLEVLQGLGYEKVADANRRGTPDP